MTDPAGGGTRWRLRNPSAPAEAIRGFPPIVGTVLAARGITTRPAADVFYKPHLVPDPDPLLLPGMQEAVERVLRAIHDGETIALFGDFDVDGVTSIAVLTLGLRALGARTVPYLPDRFSEGYGLNTGAVARLQGDLGASVLITADCGVSSVSEIDEANRLGLDVIVIDHHTVPQVLPAALAIVNPKRPDSPYPFTELAAVGVAFRFLQVLFESAGREFDEGEVLDLVALGTVVDVAPLTAENRGIVTRGLELMRRGLRPGLEALASLSGVRAERFDAGTLGFSIGPRLNAAGRLEHANLALDLVLAEDPGRARQLAEQLDTLNRRRQQQTEEAVAHVEEILGDVRDPLILVATEEVHAGIVGIVAGRLTERYHRPSIVCERGPKTSRGSARSIPAFDIVAAIRREASLLLKHGGHRAAAGLTVPNENLDALREGLTHTAVEQLSDEDLRPLIEIDAEVKLADLAGLEIKGLMRFEPCGHGNRKPVLMSRGVEVAETRRVGAGEDHLRLRLKEGPVIWPAIAFRQGDFVASGEVDVVYSLSHEWRGERLELEVQDIAPTSERRPIRGS